MRAPTLLVIEDTRDQAVLLGFAAQRARPGLRVHLAKDGLDGIAYLAAAPPFDDRRAHPLPDLVLLDLVMPEVDGFDVLEWIAERPRLAHIPIVVLTSSSRPEHERRARELGAVDFHRKPADLRALGNMVREIIEDRIGAGTMIGAHIWAAG